MTLTQQQIDQYHQDGFLVIRQALSPQQLHGLKSVTASLIDASRSVDSNNDIYDLDVGHCTDRPRLNRIKTPHLQHDVYRDLLTSDNILTCLKPLIGENIRLHNSKLNTKSANGGAAVQWHQDWAFYPHTNDDLLAIGVMLSDIGDDDGPLQVVPGSHRRDVLPHYQSGVFCGAIDPNHDEARLDQAVALTGKAGDMTIHHVRTLHGSAVNRSDSARLLLLYECGAADAWPINGAQSVYTGMDQHQLWAKMEENLICGSQPMRPRLENVPILMPLPPAPDTSSLFKVQKSGGAIDGFAAP